MIDILNKVSQTLTRRKGDTPAEGARKLITLLCLEESVDFARAVMEATQHAADSVEASALPLRRLYHWADAFVHIYSAAARSAKEEREGPDEESFGGRS